MKIGFSVLGILFLVGVLASCQNSTNFGFNNRLGKNEAPESTGTIDPDTGSLLVTDSWIQPPASETAADLIFVVDSSGSLNAERDALTNALGGFLTELTNQQVDVCIGVLLGHVGDRAGKLFAASGQDADKCLCAQDLDQTTLINKFKENIEDPPEEGTSDGGEALFYSFIQSFTNLANKAENQTVGCYRDTASLAPIFLTDENDISTSINCSSTNFTFNPNGPATVVDGNCNEAPTRANYYSNADGDLTLGAQQVLASAQAFQGVLGFLPVVVGYVGSDIPSGGENEFPYGLATKDGNAGLVDLAGGDKVDLKLATDATPASLAAFNDAFQNLGTSLANKINLLTVFDLSKKPCEGTISVKVDDSDVSFDWDGDKRVYVSASDVGSVASSIQIIYESCE